jgi:hypothetical protein
MATNSEERAEKLVFKARNLINEYLDRCDEKNTPYLCKLMSQKNASRKGVEEFVLTLMFNNNMTIGEALSEQERILDPNYIND